MIFKQFYLESLGHASYLVGDERSGRALVLDARRDVGTYFDEARESGIEIRYALDSHGHNDYLSGLTELSVRQRDLEVLAFAESEARYSHRPVKDREQIEFGNVGVEVLHTPGHTPEHICLLVYDGEFSFDEPALMLSGGALLVGDVARPDLLGDPGQVREMAEIMCRTLDDKILSKLPEHLEIFPTHVKGSLCASSIGSRLSTTLGYERRTNDMLTRISSSDEFVEECVRLDNLPAVPPFWRRMRAQNLAGVPELGVLPEPSALTPPQFRQTMATGAVVIDARSPEAYGGAHIPGALNVGLGSGFATWAGTVLTEDARVLLVLDAPSDLWEACWQLLRIGLRLPLGWLAGGMHAWRVEARPVATMPQITVHELKDKLERGEVNLLDVRQPSEWNKFRIPEAHYITGAELPDRMEEIPADKPLAVTCGSGYRSSVSASLLAKQGYGAPLMNVSGGMAAWRRAGYPVRR